MNAVRHSPSNVIATLPFSNALLGFELVVRVGGEEL
jgi:hypothetical protein